MCIIIELQVVSLVVLCCIDEELIEIKELLEVFKKMVYNSEEIGYEVDYCFYYDIVKVVYNLFFFYVVEDLGYLY